MKTCSVCQVDKPIDEYTVTRQTQTKKYYRKMCKRCWCERQKRIYNEKKSYNSKESKRPRKKRIQKINNESLETIYNMRCDGEKWCDIAEVINITNIHLCKAKRDGVILVN